MISKGYERALFDRATPKRHAYVYGLNSKGRLTQTTVLGKEHEMAQNVKDAVRATYAIARSNGPVFELESDKRHPFCKAIRANKEGQALRQALLLAFDDIRATPT